MPIGFGRLWSAQMFSSLGDGVTHAALPLIALTLTRDPMALAVVTAAGTLPWLLLELRTKGAPGSRRPARTLAALPKGPGSSATR
ncbi:hypothetical protein ABZ719_36585, partial [Streptomyces sp. NPDC006743]